MSGLSTIVHKPENVSDDAGNLSTKVLKKRERATKATMVNRRVTLRDLAEKFKPASVRDSIIKRFVPVSVIPSRPIGLGFLARFPAQCDGGDIKVRRR